MEARKVQEAVLAGKKTSSFPKETEEKDAAMVAAAAASPAAIFAFLSTPLSLLRHVACLCAGYLGLDGGLKPSVPAAAASPSSSSSAAAAAAVSQIDKVEAAESDDCTSEVVLEVRSRAGFTRPAMTRTRTLKQSKAGENGGAHH